MSALNLVKLTLRNYLLKWIIFQQNLLIFKPEYGLLTYNHFLHHSIATIPDDSTQRIFKILLVYVFGRFNSIVTAADTLLVCRLEWLIVDCAYLWQSRHRHFSNIHLICSLATEEHEWSCSGKWTAGQIDRVADWLTNQLSV